MFKGGGIHPNIADIYVQMASCHILNHSFEKALDYLEKARHIYEKVFM